MNVLVDWWKKYNNNLEEYLIILIDTDLIDKLKCLNEKYKDIKNIKIFNHYEFQEYVISSY